MLAKEAGVRGLGCLTTGLAREGARRHKTSPVATVALGQAMTAAALMGALLKTRQRVALKFEGDGPLQKIITEAASNGDVRGYVAVPDVPQERQWGAFSVPQALGRDGLLTVVKDLRLRELYQGIVPLQAGDIETDLAYYLNQSEQIPSVLAMGVQLDEEEQVAAAGGILIQAIPPYNPAIVHALGERVAELPPFEELLAQGYTPEAVFELVFDNIAIKLLGQQPLYFQCSCSRERSQQALASLGRDELDSLLTQEGEAVVDCHFCHERFVFSREDLEAMLL
ncbi:MAG: Hsp33 family molecular chaperone HslO [Chloroflexi bacterium]|nr:Hsp33 family molecular chaperone HslO [Chloroflexota bacterium]MBP8055683.1 Hsp33 family molecular chaperone HslO [Chloroflexota bacterium]